MSDYSDVWNEMHAQQIRQEEIVKDVKKRLLEEVPVQSMIKIMFEDFLNKKSDYDIAALGMQYLQNGKAMFSK